MAHTFEMVNRNISIETSNIRFDGQKQKLEECQPIVFCYNYSERSFKDTRGAQQRICDEVKAALQNCSSDSSILPTCLSVANGFQSSDTSRTIRDPLGPTAPLETVTDGAERMASMIQDLLAFVYKLPPSDTRTTLKRELHSLLMFFHCYCFLFGIRRAVVVPMPVD